MIGLSGWVVSGATNLDQTNALLWVMIAISVAGFLVTFAFLLYALAKFRDPRTRRRRFG